MGAKSKMSRGMRSGGGSMKVKGMKKQMHHSPGGKMKGFPADKHPKPLKIKHQDPMV